MVTTETFFGLVQVIRNSVYDSIKYYDDNERTIKNLESIKTISESLANLVDNPKVKERFNLLSELSTSVYQSYSDPSLKLANRFTLLHMLSVAKELAKTTEV